LVTWKSIRRPNFSVPVISYSYVVGPKGNKVSLNVSLGGIKPWQKKKSSMLPNRSG
jgi:hypothetical protein